MLLMLLSYFFAIHSTELPPQQANAVPMAWREVYVIL
jgi:hypothetical protein